MRVVHDIDLLHVAVVHGVHTVEHAADVARELVRARRDPSARIETGETHVVGDVDVHVRDEQRRELVPALLVDETEVAGFGDAHGFDDLESPDRPDSSGRVSSGRVPSGSTDVTGRT